MRTLWRVSSCREGRLDACESLTMIGVTHDGGMPRLSSSWPAASTACRAGHLRQGALAEPLSVALHGVRDRASSG